jgi:hypothetical protein
MIGADAARTGKFQVRDIERVKLKISEDAEESFKTIVIAFMLSRVQLAVQYLICKSIPT